MGRAFEFVEKLRKDETLVGDGKNVYQNREGYCDGCERGLTLSHYALRPTLV